MEKFEDFLAIFVVENRHGESICRYVKHATALLIKGGSMVKERYNYYYKAFTEACSRCERNLV